MVPEAGDQITQGLWSGVVGQDRAGSPAFLVQRELGALSGRDLVGRPAAIGQKPGVALIGGGVDKRDNVAQGVPTGFEQDGRVEHDGGRLSFADDPADRLFEGRPHFGVKDRLQGPQPNRVGEDDRPQNLAVDPGRVARGQDFGSEPGDDVLTRRGLVKQGVADPVGVKHDGPVLA